MADRPLLFRSLQTPTMTAAEAQILADQVRAIVARDLAIDSIQVARDQAREGVVVVRGRLLHPSHEVFPRWQAELNRRGYTPVLRPDGDAHSDQVALHVIAGVVRPERSRVWINVVLFVATIFTTLWTGMVYSDRVELSDFADLFRLSNLIHGWPFALSLMGILLAHELGHYFAARHHKLAVSLPYFIPLPIPPGFGITLGTLGAFIRLKEPVPDRRKLFDVGVAGPLAGLVLAVPLLFIGLMTSPVQTPPESGVYWVEGNSLFYWVAKYLVFGKWLPNPVTGEDVFINAVTAAAWFGFLITALNLLPLGQLDGGHTVFALFGNRARQINRVAVGVMAMLAIASLQPVQNLLPFLEVIGYPGWFVWLALILFLVGPFHPPPLDDVTQLDPKRRWVGYLVIVIFILIFVPVPFTLITP
ncbi:MAG: site-2 protease family protein [Chloroflexi bacterium]|nr:MAG: site-2 protease family protein [Chloroflexota bacterium]